MLLKNRKHSWNYKKSQNQVSLDCAEELQAMIRTYEHADDPMRPSINTGLKDVITKSHEQCEEAKITNSTNQLNVQKWSDDQTLGILFILNIYKKQFGQLLTDLHNDYLKRTNIYP